MGPEVQHLERPRECFPSPDLQHVLDTDPSGDLQRCRLQVSACSCLIYIRLIASDPGRAGLLPATSRFTPTG